jgi:hypothetical protein
MTLEAQIDHVESLLAVVGVRHLVSKEVPFVTKAQTLEATRMSATIEREARAVVRGEFEAVKLYSVDYDATLRDLYDEWTPKQIEKVVKSLETNAPDMDVAFQAKAKEVLDYLGGIFPRAQYTTFIGSSNVVPNDMAIYAFESVLEVLDEPARIFSFMATGAITKRQVDAFREVYPTIGKAIDEALRDAAADEKAKHPSFELDPTTELGVQRWMGQPAVPPATAALLQAAVPKPKPPGPPAPSGGSPKATIASKEALTPSQRASMGPVK